LGDPNIYFRIDELFALQEKYTNQKEIIVKGIEKII